MPLNYLAVELKSYFYYATSVKYIFSGYNIKLYDFAFYSFAPTKIALLD